MTPDHVRRRLSGPAAEPISLAQARAHLRLDHADEDALLAQYILAARAYVERITGRVLLTQTWEITLDTWPSGVLELPLAPVQSITSVQYRDTAWQLQTVDPTTYVLAAEGEPARLLLADGKRWPSGLSSVGAASVRVTLVAGYTSGSDVPADLRHALLLLVGHWYENREATAQTEPTSVPLAFDALLAAHRLHWL